MVAARAVRCKWRFAARGVTSSGSDGAWYRLPAGYGRTRSDRRREPLGHEMRGVDQEGRALPRQRIARRPQAVALHFGQKVKNLDGVEGGAFAELVAAGEEFDTAAVWLAGVLADAAH